MWRGERTDKPGASSLRINGASVRGSEERPQLARRAGASAEPLDEGTQAVLDSLPDCALWTLDPEGRVASWGRSAERLMGFRAEEILGQPFSRFYLEAESERGNPGRALELAARLHRFEDEGLRVRSDGSTFWAHAAIAATREPGGRVKSFSVMVCDLTDARQGGALGDEAEPRPEEADARSQLIGDAARVFAEAGPDAGWAIQAVAARVAEIIGESCVVALGEGEGPLRLAAVAHPDPEGRRLLRELVDGGYGHPAALPARVFRTGEPLLFSRVCEEGSLASDPVIHAFCDRYGAASLLLVPLRACSRTIGVLGVMRGDEADPYTAKDQALLEQLADLAALALENARLYSEAKAARAEAEVEKRRLHATLMQAPALISIQRGPEHRFELVNPPLQQLYGNRLLLGLSLAEALPEQSAQKALLDQVYTTGEQVHVEEMPMQMDWRSTGTLEKRYFTSTLQPLRTPDGKVEGVVTFSLDVTEHVRARQRVEALAADASSDREWLESVLDSMPTPFVLIEPQSRRICFANQAADALAGGTFPRLMSEEELGRTFRCVDADGQPIPPDQMPAARAVRGEDVRGFQMNWRIDGELRSLLIAAQPLPAAHGHPLTVLVALDDVTALQRAQTALQEAIRVRDAFLSIAGHELKTPLTTLQLQLQSLGRMLVERHAELSVERAARKMEAASRQSERLAILIGQLLDVSRINAGRLLLDLRPMDLAALVRDVAGRFEEEAEKVGSPLKVCAEGRWVGLWDRERLDQVLTNLISNAVKYGRGKPVEISLDGDESHARIQVHDHGIGIAPEDQARIFDRFERAVSDRHYGGLGLGLWIVREIVSALGGTIRVESAPGQGSLFTVELPVTAPGTGP